MRARLVVDAWPYDVKCLPVSLAKASTMAGLRATGDETRDPGCPKWGQKKGNRAPQSRQGALQTLEGKGLKWRLSLTTPSLPGVWAALRFGHGITVRTPHLVPPGITDKGLKLGLPRLPAVELRMIEGSELSPAASNLRDILDHVVRERLTVRTSGSRRQLRSSPR